MGKFVTWKPPKLYKGKRWWIEYQFRIPEELRPRYKGAKWKGFPSLKTLIDTRRINNACEMEKN
ncbi:MAG: hypothetical protein P4L51_24530 [Puia sp.]|nr:hypothetical protein [Puia sp.]